MPSHGNTYDLGIDQIVENPGMTPIVAKGLCDLLPKGGLSVIDAAASMGVHRSSAFKILQEEAKIAYCRDGRWFLVPDLLDDCPRRWMVDGEQAS